MIVVLTEIKLGSDGIESKINLQTHETSRLREYYAASRDLPCQEIARANLEPGHQREKTIEDNLCGSTNGDSYTIDADNF